MRRTLTILFLLVSIPASSQQNAIDSLANVISESKDDTSVAAAYVELSGILYISNLDTVIPLCLITKEICERNLASGSLTKSDKKRYLVLLAEALNNIGFVFGEKGNIQKQSEYYHKSLKIQEEIGDRDGQAISLNNIGSIYDNQGNIEKALEYYHRSLKIDEELDNMDGVSMSLNNIGYIYQNQGDIEKALDNFQRSLVIREDLGDKLGISISLNNIGAIFSRTDPPKALGYYDRSLKIREEIGDRKGVAFSMNNIGFIYDNQGERQLALEYHQKSLKIRQEIEDKKGESESLYNIGGIYFDMGMVQKAREFVDKSMELAMSLGYPEDIKLAAGLSSKVFRKQGSFKEALQMYELFIQMRDSIKNEKTQKAAIRQQTKYEFEKAQLVKEQNEREVVRLLAEETSRRDNLQYSVILLGLLVLGTLVLGLGKLALPPRMAEGIIFFSFLILFEFLLVLADPYIDNWSGGAPGIKLLFNAGIAALIFPMHSLFERKLKGRLINLNT